MSEPLTAWPIRARSRAIALIPAPPTPTMWIRRGLVSSSAGIDTTLSRSSGGTGVLLHQIRHTGRGVGPAECARRRAHLLEPIRCVQQRRDDFVEVARITLGVAQHHARAGPLEGLRVLRL